MTDHLNPRQRRFRAARLLDEMTADDELDYETEIEALLDPLDYESTLDLRTRLADLLCR